MKLAKTTISTLLLIMVSILIISITAQTTATSEPEIQILVVQAPIVNTFTISTASLDTQQFDTLQSSGTTRNTGKIAAVLASFLVVVMGTTFVLCLRHNKKLCFAPPKAASAPTTAKLAADVSSGDDAPLQAVDAHCEALSTDLHQSSSYTTKDQISIQLPPTKE